MNATQSARYITVTETAKLIRAALKTAFPAVKFSVRSDKYSGGASVDVRWTDGPTTKAVEAIAGQFQGATFDGMQDLMNYHRSTLNGEAVHYMADFVNCERAYSPEFLRPIAAQVAAWHNLPAPPVLIESCNGTGYIKEDYINVESVMNGGRTFTLADVVRQTAYETGADGVPAAPYWMQTAPVAVEPEPAPVEETAPEPCNLLHFPAPAQPARIAAVEITITRAEGLTEECDLPITVKTSERATCWAYADRVLAQWARTAPEGGCYDKCDFTVRYADGETYSGRYDLTRGDMTSADLAAHIDGFTACYAGLVAPYGATVEEWVAQLDQIDPGTRTEYQRFRATYQIG